MKKGDIIDRYMKHGNAACIKFLMDANSQQCTDPQLNLPTKPAYQKKLKQLVLQYKQLQKCKQREHATTKMETFLQEDFVFPNKGVAVKDKTVVQPSGSFLQDELESQKTVCQNLAGELLRTKNALAGSKLILASNKVKLAKVRIHKAAFQTKKLLLARKERDLKVLKKKNNKLKDDINKKRSELKRKSSQLHYLDEKLVRLTDKARKHVKRTTEVDERCSCLEGDIAEKQHQLNDTLDENDWLREMVQDQVTTKDDVGEYTVAMKQCVCDLLSHNVPTGQVAPVIECVLKMAGKKASDLPSKSTVNDWNIMRLLLSQQ